MPSRLRAFWDEASREADAKSALRRERRDLENSIRSQHWTNSNSLLEFKSRLSGFNKRINAIIALPWLGPLLQKRTWTNHWLFRFPTIAILRLVAFVVGLIPGFAFYVAFFTVATAMLLPTYAKFQRGKFKELAQFDRQVADDKRKREQEKQQRIEDQKREELMVFWISQFRNSSTETLLDVWAAYERFPRDHHVYFVVEHFRGITEPVLHKIVDFVISERQISAEARKLAQVRFERKLAHATEAYLLQKLGSSSQRSALERQSGFVDGLITIAMLQLVEK